MLARPEARNHLDLCGVLAGPKVGQAMRRAAPALGYQSVELFAVGEPHGEYGG